MSENITEYENLKKKIILKSREFLDLQKVKDCFSSIIDSQRSLCKIKNLNDVFILLEKRDALDHNNVSTLVQLGNLLENEDVTNRVHVYKKIFIEEDAVCACGENLTFAPTVLLPEVQNSIENQQNSEYNIVRLVI